MQKQARTVLVLFVESGVLYCALWVSSAIYFQACSTDDIHNIQILLLVEVSLGGTLVIYTNSNTFENEWNFFYHIQLFKKVWSHSTHCTMLFTLRQVKLWPIVIWGIYPTAIVLTTALTKSYCERTLKYDSVVTPQITTSPQRIQFTMRQGPHRSADYCILGYRCTRTKHGGRVICLSSRRGE